MTTEKHITSPAAYDFRLRGLAEAPGQIKAASCHRLIGALLRTAESAVRLAATGEGARRGRRPAWLEAAVDFTMSGLAPGSTVFRLEVPRLSAAAPAQFAGRPLWGEPVSPGTTALDLVVAAIRETETEDPSGRHFDTWVLSGALDLSRAARNPGVGCRLAPHGSATAGVVLDSDAAARIGTLLERIPAPQVSILSGRLDVISHERGRFQIVLDHGARLPGRIEAESVDREALRTLWGKQATLTGTVQFRSDGRPRFVEAHRLGPRVEGDNIFAELPHGERPDTKETVGLRPALTLLPRPPAPRGVARPRDLRDTWPGSEPVEELLAQLD